MIVRYSGFSQHIIVLAYSKRYQTCFKTIGIWKSILPDRDLSELSIGDTYKETSSVFETKHLNDEQERS